MHYEQAWTVLPAEYDNKNLRSDIISDHFKWLNMHATSFEIIALESFLGADITLQVT